MVNRFILNEVSYFGPGARKELPGVVARLGFKKALVVTDKGLMQFGVAKMLWIRLAFSMKSSMM